MGKKCQCGQEAVWNLRYWNSPARPNVKPRRLVAPICGAHALAVDISPAWAKLDYRLETL